MDKEKQRYVWSWAWPEWCLVFLCLAALLFSLVWHIVERDGASFFFMSGLSDAQSGWRLFWMRGVSEQPYEWWHGFGLTLFPAILALTVFFYIPFRVIHWVGARTKAAIHNNGLNRNGDPLRASPFGQANRWDMAMMGIYIVGASAANPVGRGLTAFLIFAGFGIRWIWKGLRGTIPRDVFGAPRFAPPWAYLVAGLLLQAPLIIYLIFIVRQGRGF